MNKCGHSYQPTGKSGFHVTPYKVNYVRCIKCGRNGYRIDPSQLNKSPDIVYSWCDTDPPDGLS